MTEIDLSVRLFVLHESFETQVKLWKLPSTSSCSKKVTSVTALPKAELFPCKSCWLLDFLFVMRARLTSFKLTAKILSSKQHTNKMKTRTGRKWGRRMGGTIVEVIWNSKTSGINALTFNWGLKESLLSPDVPQNRDMGHIIFIFFTPFALY
jgi:hypothetical protein